MKFKQYLEELNKLAEERPEILDMDVVTSCDDEGNRYEFVYSTPTIGYYESDDKDFIFEGHFEEWGYDDVELNAVCVN